jgi:methyl-accepting chemotaxis protein WspA
MRTRRPLSLTGKLSAMVGLFLLVFAGAAGVAYTVIERVKVNGPVYSRIVQSKDLVADVLPPPAYIIESYLDVLRMVDHADPATLGSMVDRGKQLRTDYDTRIAYWTRVLPQGQLRDTLLGPAREAAERFYRLRDEQLVPLLRAGDVEGATALSRGAIRNAYEEHRRAIDQVVRLSTADVVASEASAGEALSSSYLLLALLALACVAVVLLIAFFGARLASTLTGRIALARDTAERVAAGDLTTTVDIKGSDESAELLRAISSMNVGLQALVSRVKGATIELMGTATEFNSTSRQQEQSVSGFGASTSEIAAAVKEISATSQELLATMDNLSRVTSQTAEVAEDGRVGLDRMDTSMQQLTSATATISNKLAVIREKAVDINKVVTTITKVADQTNLLSINAAIEAEKAGELGLGFLVLAREIRRLADQTAVATLDIEHMVREMQTAVTAGVMEMDRFSEEVRSGVRTVGEIGGQLGTIIGQVRVLSGRFEVVNEGMRSQSEGARQIDQAMIHLSDVARQTTGSLREFKVATERLQLAITTLREGVSVFKVS